MKEIFYEKSDDGSLNKKSIIYMVLFCLDIFPFVFSKSIMYMRERGGIKK